MDRQEATEWLLNLLENAIEFIDDVESGGIHHGDIVLIIKGTRVEIHCEVYPPQD